MFLISNTPAFSETQSCERKRLDSSGFSTTKVAESWYPKNLYLNTFYYKKKATFGSREANLVIRGDKKRMHAVFKLKSSSGRQRTYKVIFLPNGEMHANLGEMGGFKSPGGAVYKCSNWYKNKIINTSGIKSNSNNFNSKNSSSNKFSSNTNRISDEAICNMATDRGSWRKVGFAQEYVQEAKKRGLSCGVYSSTSSNLSNYSDWKVCDESDSGKPEWIKEAKYRGLNCGSSTSSPSSTSSLLQNYSDWRVCDEVKLGKLEWLEEAKRRRLNCGVNAAEAEKKRQAQLRKIAAEAKKEEKARQERIKAEQEKIKKKAKEEARKKKLAEEKAKKIAEQKAKKEAEIKKKKLAEEKLKIKNAKEESSGFYKDIISYVKTANDIDIVQLSEFFENKPEPTINWSVKDLKVYEKLKTFINKSINFREFHTKEKEKRAKAKLNLKLATLDKLEDNLKNFKIILKENFGNNQKTKLIRQYIYKTKKIVSDDKYEQNQADKILSENETYLITYKMNKNKLYEIDAYLNASKNELSQILKDNFGTSKGNKASKYIKNIDNAKSLSEKTELKTVIERFLNPPPKIVSVQKQENNKITFNSNSSELSNIPNNIICNRVDEGNTDYLLEAKRRGLNCATSVVSKQNAKDSSVNLSTNQNTTKPLKVISEKERFISKLGINNNYEVFDLVNFSKKFHKLTEMQHDLEEKKMKNNYYSFTGKIYEIDNKNNTHNLDTFRVSITDDPTFTLKPVYVHANCYALNSFHTKIFQEKQLEEELTIIGRVRSVGDWLGIQLDYCTLAN